MRETRAATVESRDGLLFVRIRPNVRQTVDDARANLDACVVEAGGRRAGVLLDITRAVPLDPAVRHFYTGRAVDDVCTALALVVEMNALGRILGNVYLRVARLSVPTQIFHHEKEAVAWLRETTYPAPGPRA
jgi:hypothetical protein